MDAGLGSWAAHHADSFARAFASAGVGLSALAAHGQTAQVAHTAVAFDALEALQVHADFAAQVAFNDVLPVLDRMNNLGELLFGEVLGANARVDVGLGENIARVAWANA